MGKTDKDAPYRVLKARQGTVHHDHSSGPCDLGVPGLMTWRDNRNHWKSCAKRVEVPVVCTKTEPYLGRYGVRTCYMNLTRWEWRDGIEVPVREWVSCVGHPDELRRDPTIPCVCDTWVYARCEIWADDRNKFNNREKGKGDYVEWSTPRSRRAATRKSKLTAIREGLTEAEEA